MGLSRSLALMLFCCSAIVLQSFAQTTNALRPKAVLAVMRKTADWQINEFALHRVNISKTDWQNGTLYAGLMALNNLSTAKKYDDFLYQVGEDNRWNMGKYRFFADDYCVAQMYTQMYIKHQEPKMIAKWTLLADSIVAHRFDEPLKVVPDINHREWAWCDALFMGPPSLAYLSNATGNPKYVAKADSLWWKTSDYLFDKKENLYYRDSRFFDRSEANGQKVFWSRGNGWVMAGLVRMLQNMPANSRNIKRYQHQLRQMANRVAILQQADGSWHASLLNPQSFPDKETSGTGFYCYALAWGINNGLLSKSKFLPVVTKAWNALATAVQLDGKLGYVQQVGEKPMAAGYENTTVYGVGALLLAGSEMYILNH